MPHGLCIIRRFCCVDVTALQVLREEVSIEHRSYPSSRPTPRVHQEAQTAARRTGRSAGELLEEAWKEFKETQLFVHSRKPRGHWQLGISRVSRMWLSNMPLKPKHALFVNREATHSRLTSKLQFDDV